jgi:glycerol-3-phosphate cytidylyltransferase
LKRVITFGTFDVLHVGHLSILERAAELGEHLTVGISTDALSINKKGRLPVYPEAQRLALVSALRCVDATFLEHSLEAKANYIREHNAEILVMGDDWAGRFDDLSSLCKVIYLPRTPAISTTAVIEMIRR